MFRKFYCRLRTKRRLAKIIKRIDMKKQTPLERDMNLLEAGVI